jgi:hypothetical protein
VRRVLVWAVLALLVAGCQARLAVDIAVDVDGAGQLAVSLAADADLLERTRATGSDPLSDLAATGRALEPQRWRTVDVTDGEGTRTVTVSTGFAGPDEFADLAEDLTTALAAPELVPLSDLRLELTDEEIRLTGVAGLEPTQAVTELGVQPEQAVAIMRDGEHLAYDLSVSLPGEVLHTTGVQHEGGRITWTVAPGERVELVAMGDRPGGRWWVFATAGAVVGLVALMLLGLLARGRGRSAGRARGAHRASGRGF